MLFDKTTEAVAHFIGSFGSASADARLRVADEGIRQKQTTDLDFAGQGPPTILLRAPHEAVGFDPGLTPFWFSSDDFRSFSEEPNFSHTKTIVVGTNNMNAPNTRAAITADPKLDEVSVTSINITSPALGAVIAISYQENYLTDHDFYGDADITTFIAPSVFDRELDTLVEHVQPIIPEAFGNPFEAIATGPEMGKMLSSGFQANVINADTLDAQATFLSGEAVTEITINGIAADEMPDLSECLPDQMTKSDTEAEVDQDVEALINEVGTAAAAAAEYFDVEDGSEILAGGNLAINETSVVSQHVDAPVIAVLGDVFNLAAISQVNVIRDHDVASRDVLPSNTSINAATFVAENSVKGQETTAISTTEFDSNVIVTRIDSDFVNVNWVHQYNLVSDHDAAQITFSGEDTFLNFGDNVALNQTSILEFSEAYDLIFVGGSMYDIVVIYQTNILLDDDTVSDVTDWPASVSTSDNLVYNEASIQSLSTDTYTPLVGEFVQAGTDLAAGGSTLSDDVRQHDVFDGDAPLEVLYIVGDLLKVTAVAQTNIVGDADQIRVELDALYEHPESVVTTTTGSNAAINIATVADYGTDSIIMTGGEVYDDLLLYQAEFIDTDAQPLGAIPSPLAFEAVAFLADDMMETVSFDSIGHLQNLDSTASVVDMLGSVIA